MNRNKQTEILGGIITLVILILLIFLSNVETNKLSYIENIVNKFTSPIERLATDIKNKLQKNNTYFEKMDSIIEENEKLKERNSELEIQLRELEKIKAENTTLNEYMELTQKYESYDTIPAYVISRDVSNFNSNLVINAGSREGVEEKMTVIADRGLVGHVISVDDHTCKVQVIIDPASTVSCTISRNDQSIICKGTLDNNQVLRATYIPTDAELIQNDTIYTSGVGGIYSKGIVIGTIKEIVTTNNITDRYAIVEPMVDFSTIDTVLVIKN